jgi:cytoskeleton protein RodZ
MAEIGATLRAARQRQRIDISEIESETKIRAKYLRALENEEWDQLPGPTYVKSFLRTYADALGLDGRLLIEEYKLRHERLSDVELQPIRPPGVRRDRRRPPRRAPRGLAVIVVVLALLAALYALGQNRNGGDASSGAGPAASTGQQSRAERAARARAKARRKRARERRRGAAQVVRLRIVPTGPVYVCLQKGNGRTVVDGVILQAGSRQPTYKAKRFKVLLGNSEARLRINGRGRAVPPTASAATYEIRPPRKMRALPAAQAPQCSA